MTQTTTTTTTTTKITQVPHLGGIQVGYRISDEEEGRSGEGKRGKKPVLVCINSMCTTSALFRAQFESEALTDAVTLLAIEPLGHGHTRRLTGGGGGGGGRIGHGHGHHFTYWDSAVVALQLLRELGIPRAFAMGTSQGGWVVARMALLAGPDQIQGLILLGTSMDHESTESRRLHGCWDPWTALMPHYDKWNRGKNNLEGGGEGGEGGEEEEEEEEEEFVVDDEWCHLVVGLGFGDVNTPELTRFWYSTIKETYRGDEGREQLRLALCCLLERDGLLLRLDDITVPVYWLQGSQDPVFPVKAAAEHLERFTRSDDKMLEVVEKGGHYLNATNPGEVEAAVLRMVERHFHCH